MHRKSQLTNAFLSKADGVAAVVSDDSKRVALLSPSIDQPVILRGTGAALWSILDDVASTQELIERIAETYCVDPSDVSSDVERFVESLIDQRILVDTNATRQP